jgi:hypothetical protein
MKRLSLITLSIFCIGTILFAETNLGGRYLVARDDSPYSAEEGDHSIKTLSKGTYVRLIKDETVAEAIVFAPFRIIKLMVHIEPRGNWLVEDDNNNRGYMWDSDLRLVQPKKS